MKDNAQDGMDDMGFHVQRLESTPPRFDPSNTKEHLADKTAQDTQPKDFQMEMGDRFDSGVNTGEAWGPLEAARAEEKRLKAKRRKVQAQRDSTDGPYELVTRERVAPIPISDVISLIIAFVLFIAALGVAPATILAALILAEFPPVMDEPLFGFAYSAGVLLAIWATHGIDGELKSDRLKRLWRLATHLATLAAFANWALVLAAMSGLGSDLSGLDAYDAEIEAQTRFLWAAILLELCGAASAFSTYSSVSHKNKKRVLVQSPARAALDQELSEIDSALGLVTQKVAAFEGELERLDAARKTYCARTKDRLAAIEADIAAKAAETTARCRAEQAQPVNAAAPSHSIHTH